MQKRTYTEEFRKQAVALAKELGSVSQAAKQLGVPDGNLYGWRELAAARSQQPLESGQSAASQLAELKQLRKENADLKKINLILKQCAAFFSQDQLK
jgi:transposase-like protein